MRSDEFFDKLFKVVQDVRETKKQENATLLEFKSEEEAFAHMRKVYSLKPGDHVILHGKDSGRINALFRYRKQENDFIFLVAWNKEHGLYAIKCSPLAIEIPEGLVD